MDDLELVDHLKDAHFNKILEGEELYEFDKFIKEKAIPNKGFVIGAPIIGEKKNWVWFLYHLKDAYIELYRNSEIVRDRQIILEIGDQEVYVPRDDSKIVTNPPKEWKAYPIWRIELP